MNLPGTSEQMRLPDILEPDPSEAALQILRDEHLRNNGDLSAFFEEIKRNRPKRPDPEDAWMPPREFLQKQL
ncbi:MAG: hypothetical protein LBK99_08340 [Opitutaceae bacterium]|nr:hypothetical protein [Opitutaceae bacterium]